MKKEFSSITDAKEFAIKELKRRADFSSRLWTVFRPALTIGHSFVTDRFEDVLIAFALTKGESNELGIEMTEFYLGVENRQLFDGNYLWREVFLNYDKIKNEMVLIKSRKEE